MRRIKTCFILLVITAFHFSEMAAQESGFSEELRIRVEMLNGRHQAGPHGDMIHCRTTVPQFYQEKLFVSVWDDYLAEEMLAAVEDCLNDGLNPDDYHLQALKSLAAKPKLSGFEMAEYELLLTDAFLLLATHLISGKVDPARIDPSWKVVRSEGDPVSLLHEAVKSREIRGTLEGVKPGFKAYSRLKERLLTYKKIATEGGWPEVAPGSTLKLNSESQRVEQLRKRLRMTGDLKSYTVEDLTIYDRVVSEAVQAFQRRHGLTPDGNVGKETLEALNTPVEKRIGQILLNMERCRWLPRDLGSSYIMVNLPAFELEVVKDQVVEMEMDVAIGKLYRQTPVFTASMTYLVFNPYWTVPPTILSQDMLPAQARNPNHLTHLNIKVIGRDGVEVAPQSIDWANITARNFPYTLRQEPGPSNALGRVKFMFPNVYNVYMHDTNNREVFARTERAMSSGCIRLSDPMKLAEYLLAPQGSWSRERMGEVLSSRRNFTVLLKNAIPVHMQYWTAFIDERGVLNFRKDVYSRDQRVLQALNAPPPKA